MLTIIITDNCTDENPKLNINFIFEYVLGTINSMNQTYYRLIIKNLILRRKVGYWIPELIREGLSINFKKQYMFLIR